MWGHTHAYIHSSISLSKELKNKTIRYNFFYPWHKQVVSKGYLFHFSGKVFPFTPDRNTCRSQPHCDGVGVVSPSTICSDSTARNNETHMPVYTCTMWCHFIKMTQHIKTTMLNRIIKVCPKDRYIQEHNFN